MCAHYLSENSRYLIFDRSEKCVTIHKKNNFPWLCLFRLLSLWDYSVYLYPGTDLRNFVFSYMFFLSCYLYRYCIVLLWLIHLLDDLSWILLYFQAAKHFDLLYIFSDTHAYVTDVVGMRRALGEHMHQSTLTCSRGEDLLDSSCPRKRQTKPKQTGLRTGVKQPGKEATRGRRDFVS